MSNNYLKEQLHETGKAIKPNQDFLESERSRIAFLSPTLQEKTQQRVGNEYRPLFAVPALLLIIILAGSIAQEQPNTYLSTGREDKDTSLEFRFLPDFLKSYFGIETSPTKIEEQEHTISTTSSHLNAPTTAPSDKQNSNNIQLKGTEQAGATFLAKPAPNENASVLASSSNPGQAILENRELPTQSSDTAKERSELKDENGLNIGAQEERSQNNRGKAGENE